MASTSTGTLPNYRGEDDGVQQCSANFCLMNCRRIQTLTLQLWGHQWGLRQEATLVSLCTLAEADTLAHEGAILATTATQPGLLIQGTMMEATQAIRVLTSTSTFYLSPQNPREQILANFDNFKVETKITARYARRTKFTHDSLKRLTTNGH